MGQVKWFNNKTGYGFITIVGDSEYVGKDIFTHYSAVRVSNSQYKYLTQGEYVECNVIATENAKHEYQSADITGICGGTLMCEVRNNNLANKPSTGRPQSNATEAPAPAPAPASE